MDAEMEEAPAQLLDLPDALVLHILCQLPERSTLAACRRSCTRLGELAADDSVWAPVCLADFGLCERRAPPSADGPGTAASSYFEAARGWAAFAASLNLSAFRDHGGRISALVASAVAAAEWWAAVEEWCASDMPELGATLGLPATPAAWASFVTSIGADAASLPHLLPLRLLSAIHDGQDLSVDLETAQAAGAIELDQESLARLADTQESDMSRMRSLGLLGGYAAYDLHVSVRLFPLRLMAAWTQLLRERLAGFVQSHLVVAGSHDLAKYICLDLATGRVHISGARHREQPTPVLPPALSRVSPALPCGVLLSWLSDYARQLGSGELGAAELVPLDSLSRGVCLMPRSGPRCSTAVTRGIQVVASAVQAHECGMRLYSLRLRLLLPGEEGYEPPAVRGFATAQLRSRHWRIRRSEETDAVHGDGVVGKFPLLGEGGWRDDEQSRAAGPSGVSPADVRRGAQCEGTFIYQSMSGPSDSFEGEISFVPGSLRAPTGDEFQVKVARFPLARRDEDWAF